MFVLKKRVEKIIFSGILFGHDNSRLSVVVHEVMRPTRSEPKGNVCSRTHIY